MNDSSLLVYVPLLNWYLIAKWSGVRVQLRGEFIAELFYSRKYFLRDTFVSLIHPMNHRKNVLCMANTFSAGTPVRMRTWGLESFQDCLIKLYIKPLIHLLEISTFSLNNVIDRLTKIMNRADKNWAHF